MENYIQLSYDRVVDGTETARNVVGASTSADRKLLETDTTKWVWVNYTTGNDTTGNGSSGTPYKTIVKGATDVNGTTKTVVHVGDNSTYNENITKPTQAAIGYTPTWNVASGKTLSSTGMLYGFYIIGDTVSIAGNIINCTMSGITTAITVSSTCTFWCNNIVSDNAVLWTFSPGAAGTLNCFDNIFANNSLQILEIDGSGENIIFAQNVFYGNSYLQLSNNDGDEIIYGNIFAGNTNIYCLEADTTIQFQYCIIHQEGGLNGVGNNNLDQYSKIADPLFRSREFPFNYMIAAISDNGIYNSVGVEMLPYRYRITESLADNAAQTAAEANLWDDICWSDDLSKFVAVSRDGTNRVMTSSNGTSWAAQAASEANIWAGVCWASGLSLFVAVSQDGTNRVMTSPTGTTWTARTAAAQISWNSIAWSEELGLLVAVGGKTSLQNISTAIMYSDDGINWIGANGLTGAYQDETWNAVTWSPELGIFCAVGYNLNGNYVITSPDGVMWSGHPGAYPDRWTGVAWSPELGLFCAVGQDNNGRIMTSSDGINWESQTAPVLTYWKAVCWSSYLGKFIAISTTSGDPSELMESKNGTEWVSLANPEQNRWQAIVYSESLNLFCAVSDNGTNRVLTISPGTFLNNYQIFYGIVNDCGAIDMLHTVSYTFTDATIRAPYEIEQNISAIDYIEHDRADGDKGIFFDKQQIELFMKWKLLKSTEAEVIKSILFSGGVIRLYPNPNSEATYYLEGKVIRSGAFNLGASVRPGVGYIEPSLKMVLPVTRTMLDARNGVLI